jgi:hypothetical protein
MPYGLSIKITDTATPALRDLKANLRNASVRAVMGRAGSNTVKDHLFGLAATRRNKLGGKSTRFYARAARSTNFRLLGGGIRISVNQVGIAQRYYGGTIRPVTTKYLTIPARAMAHGKRAGEFPNLKVGFGRGRRVGFLYTQKGKQKTILFWLVKKVVQKADESVLPPMDAISTAMVGAAGKYLQLQWDRKHGK